MTLVSLAASPRWRISKTLRYIRFMVNFLNNRNNLIVTKIMSEESIEQAVIYPREKLKHAIVCECSAIFLCIIIANEYLDI